MSLSTRSRKVVSHSCESVCSKYLVLRCSSRALGLVNKIRVRCLSFRPSISLPLPRSWFPWYIASASIVIVELPRISYHFRAATNHTSDIISLDDRHTFFLTDHFVLLQTSKTRNGRSAITSVRFGGRLNLSGRLTRFVLISSLGSF